MKPFVGYLYWFFRKTLELTYIKNNLNLNLNFIYFLINFGADFNLNFYLIYLSPHPLFTCIIGLTSL